MTRRPWAALAASLVVVAVAAGCGSGGSGDATPTSTSTAGSATSAPEPGTTRADEIEQDLVEGQRRNTPDLSVGAASCPDVVPDVPGSAFECTLQVEGVALPYTVTFVASSSELGTGDSQYAFRQAKALVEVAKVAASIRSEVAGQGRDVTGVTVDCGAAKVHVLDVGQGFECTLSGAGPAQRVRVTVEDDAGRLSFRTVP